MDMESGFLSIESFLKALSSMQRQPKMDSLQGIFYWLALSFRGVFVLNGLCFNTKDVDFLCAPILSISLLHCTRETNILCFFPHELALIFVIVIENHIAMYNVGMTF